MQYAFLNIVYILYIRYKKLLSYRAYYYCSRDSTQKRT